MGAGRASQCRSPSGQSLRPAPMPLSWNEIKDRAPRFSREWKREGPERAEAQSFGNGFFDVFGIDRRRVAIFEKQVEFTRAGRKLKRGRIDAFWKGVLLIEHKSAGEDLERVRAGYRLRRRAARSRPSPLHPGFRFRAFPALRSRSGYHD